MNKHYFFMNGFEEKNSRNIISLSAEEEKYLSKQILAGEAAKKQLSEENLSGGKRCYLEETIQAGEEAYNRLVLSNLPRASKFAAEAVRKNPYGLNDYEDYMQIAMKVICSCARTYNWEHGSRFGTYVHRCIKNELMRENAKNGYTVRIPEEKLSLIHKLKQLTEFESLSYAAKILNMEEEDAVQLLCASAPGKSLQSSVDTEDSDIEFGETIADDDAVTAEDIEDRIDRENMLERIWTAFFSLSEQEQYLLTGRLLTEGKAVPLRSYVGTVAKTTSGVQKKQIAAEKHLREIYFSLPLAD